MPTFLIAIVSLAMIGIGPVLLLVSVRWFMRSDDVSERLNEYLTEPARRSRGLGSRLSVQTRELTGSLVSRLLKPWLSWIGKTFARLTPTGTMEYLTHQLVIAGNPLGLGAGEFLGIMLGFLAGGILLGFLILSRSLERSSMFAALAVVMLSFLLPRTWLQTKIRGRQNHIRRGLPDALDMLSVCASAGLGFDQSLQRVSEYWETPVGYEFGRVVHEMEMGLSRRDALRNLADRLDLAEMSSFVSFVLQTEQLGLSISDTLHSQAEQMRILRRLRAQEQAQKVPTKMIFPMVFLIFPALLAIIMGPVVPSLLKFFENF